MGRPRNLNRSTTPGVSSGEALSETMSSICDSDKIWSAKVVSNRSRYRARLYVGIAIVNSGDAGLVLEFICSRSLVGTKNLGNYSVRCQRRIAPPETFGLRIHLISSQLRCDQLGELNRLGRRLCFSHFHRPSGTSRDSNHISCRETITRVTLAAIVPPQKMGHNPNCTGRIY